MTPQRKQELTKQQRDGSSLIEKIQGLREPLSVINGAVHFLASRIDKTAEKELHYLEIIKEQIKRADASIVDIIKDLPDLP